MRSLKQIAFLVFSLLATTHVHAAASKPPATMQPPSSTEDTSHPFNLNPDTLKTQLLDRNFSLVYGANRVHQSRIELDRARSALLPSLKLGFNFLAYGGFGAVFSSADFLLNFLIPTLWFQNFRQVALLHAEEDAYLTLKLNQYNSGLNLYFGLQSDLHLRDFLNDEVNSSRELEYLAQQALQNGYGTEVDVAQAVSQTATLEYQLLQTESTLADQFGQAKKMLVIPQGRELRIDDVKLPESRLENLDFKRAYETVYEKAPERSQMDQLIKAAERAKWASVFAFIQGFTASAATASNPITGRVTGVDSSFNKLTGRGSFDLGFAQIPEIRLTNSQQQEMLIRREELRFEIERIVATALQQIKLAQRALENAQISEDRESYVYNSQKNLYLEGRLNFSELVLTKNRLQNATLNRVNAETSVQVIRAALLRMNLEDRYARIDTCHVAELKERDMKHLKDKGYSVEQICAMLKNN
ncbi:MAG: TolC family protein [Bdellovibrionota bacterium]